MNLLNILSPPQRRLRRQSSREVVHLLSSSDPYRSEEVRRTASSSKGGVITMIPVSRRHATLTEIGAALASPPERQFGQGRAYGQRNALYILAKGIAFDDEVSLEEALATVREGYEAAHESK